MRARLPRLTSPPSFLFCFSFFLLVRSFTLLFAPLLLAAGLILLLRDEQQITTVEDLKLLTKEDLRDMGFSVGAGNRLYKWVRLHRAGEDEDLQ